MFKQQKNEETALMGDVARALRAWKDAERYFREVSDPDLVDVAIYDIEAARRRYMYMLKCAKQEM